MHKRVKQYRLTRCGETLERERKQRTKTRLALAGVWMSVCVAMGAVLPVLLPFDQSSVLAAGLSKEDAPESYTSEWMQGEFSDESVQMVNEMLFAGITAELPEIIREEIPKERCDILVAIDAGHGGEDEGCSRNQVCEKDVNLRIAEIVGDLLREMGYQVLLIREGDEGLTLADRVALANSRKADIYVSIHQNACEEQSSDVSGIEVWYNEAKADGGSERLAKLIHKDVLLYTGAKDREVIADDSLVVIRDTDMPACLVETGFLSNRAERELLNSEEYQTKLAEGIVSGIDLYFFPKTMYLTFDDGPSAENTEAVLDILKERGIKATFFLVGENVEKHPEVAKRIAEEGHTIGIHCYRHDYHDLYQSVDSYVEDFEKAWDIVYKTTGVEAELFRFPGGSINAYNKAVYQDIIDEMTEKGYIYFDWNASLEDATKHNEPERLVRNATESTLGRKRVVMLAHDVIYNTTQCLEEILDAFPEYRMLPLSEDVEPIHF